ncbi:hypothetical protein CLW00_10362 [Mongoliibacter ruber]|uniref:Uncharacterized protein n=1 Tax=Mongoliibacter ruber TaxID=1750599 RepID=A0A2T0WQG8_9BACT|nr:hypothetical protein CLW00_10362 [Mongoliibacter ruber]
MWRISREILELGPNKLKVWEKDEGEGARDENREF